MTTTQLSPASQKFLQQHQHQTIVFTNGCFDILHPGHVSYLNEAKKLGDVLFIGLNSDQSVKRLKGEERPIHHQLDRKFMLENLKAVDCVEIFEEDTPLELIKMVKPKVLVKGGDWPAEKIVGFEFVTSLGGKVLSLNFIPGHSTTSIINTIRSL